MFNAPFRFPSLVFLFLISTLSVSAQVSRTTFKGIIHDDTDGPLPGVTLMLLNPADSVLSQFATTDVHGAFTLKNIPKGDYLLNIAFLGMESIFQPLTSGTLADMDLGTIKMQPASKLLSEVEVKADLLPIEIKKDTISYNADAFQTQPNAVVEDLLKKLPGIEVQADGSIKAQGENVEKVLVDGKEFFGSDPKMATKNLPASAIKKVKVYDKKSDIAEFTGVDDGEREKTINLQLKEEFKKGLFGKAEAGYGTDNKYKASASFNRFNKTTQLSFLGQFNNVNEQGFSFNDQMNFSGGNMGGGGGGRGGEFRMTTVDIPYADNSGTGIINTAAGGLNFNWQKSKKFNVRTSYFYNDVENDLLQTAFRQNLTEIPFETEENSDDLTVNRSHRMSLYSEIKPDSMHEFNINARVNIGDGTAVSESFLQNRITGLTVESESLTNTDRLSDNLSLNSSASYVRRFGNKGRNVATTVSINKSDNDNQSTLKALTEYFNTGETEALDQLQYTISDNLQWNGQIAYTEPLKKRRFLELNYFYNQVQADYDKGVDDIINTVAIPNSDLSVTYTSLYQFHRPSATFRYSGETQNVNIALQYQVSELTGQDNKESGSIKKTYMHFLPRIVWRNDIGNGKNMRFNYSTRINPPSITQLSPVIDNTDPLRLYTGNPDLNAEYNHTVSVNFHSFTQFSNTSFFASVNGNFTKDKIINSRSVDAQFREISSPINIENESSYGLYSSFGRPFKPLHSRFNINTNISYTNTQNVINTELLDLNRWSRSGGISFTNLNSKVIEYNVGGQWTFSDSYYKVNDALNQNTLLQNYFVDATLTFWKKWRLNGNYNYNLYSSDAFAEDQSLPLLKASISRFVFPKDKGQIILSVFDALDENRGLSRSSQVNYIEEIRSNSIGRYVMLSFVYNVRGAGEEPPGSFRPMGHRR